MEKQIQIAIDGPAGAGKSTIAKLIAERLNILYLDTGAMYRAFSLYAIRRDVSSTDEISIQNLFKDFDLHFEGNKIILNGEDMTKAIRTKQVDDNVALYASNPFVREKMVALQQEIAIKNSVIMEGRDITSVVLPNAEYKFYLDASAEVRAKRRCEQNALRGIDSNFDEVLDSIVKRDELDSSRAVGALQISSDSEYIDTSSMTVDEVIETVCHKVV